MNKEMIEEMAKVIKSANEINCIRTCDTCGYYDDDSKCISFGQAIALYEQGYRKLPKDSVVLSKEEYEKLKNESIDKLFADDKFFKEEFKANEEYLQKRANRDYVKLVKKQARKETAEKILNEVNRIVNKYQIKVNRNDYELFGFIYMVDCGDIALCLDKLAKQFGVELKD